MIQLRRMDKSLAWPLENSGFVFPLSWISLTAKVPEVRFDTVHPAHRRLDTPVSHIGVNGVRQL
jgi:hypothetical protein